MGTVEYTGIVTCACGGGQIKSSPGSALWVVVSAGACGGAWELNNSACGCTACADLVSGVAPANSIDFINFGDVGEGAIWFRTGIYADVAACSNITLTVGYI